MMRCGKGEAQSLSPKLRAQVESLHLADAVFEFVQRDAPGEMLVVFGQQQTAVRRDVIARKLREFFIKVLEAEAEPERLCILHKQFAGLFDLRGRLGLQEMD